MPREHRTAMRGPVTPPSARARPWGARPTSTTPRRRVLKERRLGCGVKIKIEESIEFFKLLFHIFLLIGKVFKYPFTI